MKKWLILSTTLLTFIFLTTAHIFAIDKNKPIFGKGSWYGDKFHGRKTASGERYDMNKYTAAHKKLPFGTVIKVTNMSNGKSVKVRVNDRGPFVKNREIDLSKKAAQDLGYLKAGIADLKLEIVFIPGQDEKNLTEDLTGPEDQELVKDKPLVTENDPENDSEQKDEKDKNVDGIISDLQDDLGDKNTQDADKAKPVLKEKEAKEEVIDFDKPTKSKSGNTKDFEGVYQIFVVQLGAFTSEDKALAYQKKLADKGIETYIAKIDRDAMTFFKVREKNVFKDLNQVKERWQQLRKMGLECFVIGKFSFGS